MKTKTDQTPEKDDNPKSNNVSSHIKHISGYLNSDDLYALPNKRKENTINRVEEAYSDEENFCEEKGKIEETEGFEDKDANKDLPPGWEKHEGKLNEKIFFSVQLQI